MSVSSGKGWHRGELVFPPFLVAARFFSVIRRQPCFLLPEDDGSKWLSVYRCVPPVMIRHNHMSAMYGLFSYDSIVTSAAHMSLFGRFFFVSLFLFFPNKNVTGSLLSADSIYPASRTLFVLRTFVSLFCFVVLQVAFVQTPQRFRKDLPDDPLGNHAASQVSCLDGWVSPKAFFSRLFCRWRALV